MILHVETNAVDFTSKLNEQLRDTYEELLVGSMQASELT